MLKKVITIVLSLCLIFSISVMAENTAGDKNFPNTSSERPRGEMPSGDIAPPEGFAPSKGEFTPPQTDGNESTESSQIPDGNQQFGGQMPGGMGRFPDNMQNSQNAVAEQPGGFLGFVKTYSTPITSVVLLGLAYIFVIFYKRKRY